MSSCNNCKAKSWTCLSCNKKISFESWQKEFDKEVAVYCDCCDHQFACKTCYTKEKRTDRNPFDYWVSKFGVNHSVKDRMSGESNLSRMLQALTSNPGFLQGGGSYSFNAATNTFMKETSKK